MIVNKKIKQNVGFTLLEMLTVISLIATLMTTVLPTIHQSYVQIQMDIAITQLHKDIRWAQRLADQQGKSVNIQFLRMNPVYYSVVVSKESQPRKKVYLPEDLTTFTGQTITINSDKSFRNNGHIMIQKGDVRRYVYYYQSGRSRITAKPE